MKRLKNSFLASSVLLMAATFSNHSTASNYTPLPSTTPTPLISNNWYIDVSGGVAFLPDTSFDGLETTYNVGWDVAGAVGYRGGPMRYEVEYVFQRAGLNKIGGIEINGSIKANSGLFNVLYTFGDAGAPVNPYLGVGIGYSSVNQSAATSEGAVAYQARGGVSFSILDNAAFTVEYRYFGTGDIDFLGGRFQSHIINGGIIYYVQ